MKDQNQSQANHLASSYNSQSNLLKPKRFADLQSEISNTEDMPLFSSPYNYNQINSSNQVKISDRGVNSNYLKLAESDAYENLDTVDRSYQALKSKPHSLKFG